MAEIKYFGSDNNGSFVRPLNFRFPAGLNVLTVSASYLVVAGGGGGGGSAGVVGTAGTANTGGGGGGGGYSANANGGSGGSGIVIISYTSGSALFTGGTVTTSGGSQIHSFTGDGSLVGIPAYSVN